MNDIEKLKKDIKLLGESIIKWERIANGTGVDKQTENCPLCQEYTQKTGTCTKCPVCCYVNDEDCLSTPYTKWLRHNMDNHTSSMPYVYKIHCFKCVALAMKELSFLEKVRNDLMKKLNILNIKEKEKTMEISINELKELTDSNCKSSTDVNEEGPWEIGKKYFIRTVTMHITGELTSVGDKELVLKDAAWIADSGRFHEAIRDISECEEVEPFDKPVIVGRGSIVDATEISSVTLEVK